MEGSKRRKRKNDRIDAHKLARLGQMDAQSLHPLQHRSREVRQDRVLLRGRDALVAVRTELINSTRGLVKSMGQRRPRCSNHSFASQAEEGLPVEIREALRPLVQLAAALSDCIQEYGRKVEAMASQKYGHTKLLRPVKGVGPITARAYVLTLENPERFAKSRDVGPYLGLVPKLEDSGDSQPPFRHQQGRGQGDAQAAIGSAQYILGPFGPDTNLRRFELRLCERGREECEEESGGGGGPQTRRLAASTDATARTPPPSF
jgi:transposase